MFLIFEKKSQKTYLVKDAVEDVPIQTTELADILLNCILRNEALVECRIVRWVVQQL